MKNWIKITEVENVPSMGSRTVLINNTEIALFKTKEGSIFAINNTCPHKQGKLADGLVHGNNVTCPLHNWDIDLRNGKALGDDHGCTNIYESKIENNFFFINL